MSPIHQCYIMRSPYRNHSPTLFGHGTDLETLPTQQAARRCPSKFLQKGSHVIRSETANYERAGAARPLSDPRRPAPTWDQLLSLGQEHPSGTTFADKMKERAMYVIPTLFFAFPCMFFA